MISERLLDEGLEQLGGPPSAGDPVRTHDRQAVAGEKVLRIQGQHAPQGLGHSRG